MCNDKGMKINVYIHDIICTVSVLTITPVKYRVILKEYSCYTLGNMNKYNGQCLMT